MKNQSYKHAGMRSQKVLLAVCVAMLSSLFAFGLVGCSAPAGSGAADSSGQSTGTSSTGTEDALEEQVMIGEITSISETELLVEATSDSSDFLQGPVRVNVEALEASLIETLNVGDTIRVVYSGQVGMSSPPYVAAVSLVVGN